MVTIEQIRLLDQKVHSAVERISLLKQENQSLKSKLEHYESRITELERLIESFKRDQGEIEQGITNALDELNRLEDDLEEKPATEETSSSDEAPVGVVSEEDPSADADEADQEESPSPSPSIIPNKEDAEEGSDDSRTGELDIF